jgi:transcriptional regulator with XRE-family HTH domain
MSKASESFRKRLRIALEPRGASAEFRRKTGFAPGSIINWLEKGQTPTIDNLDRVAEALGATPSELLKPEGKPIPADILEALGKANDDALTSVRVVLRGHGLLGR